MSDNIMRSKLKLYVNRIVLRLDEISDKMNNCDDPILYAKLSARWDELVEIGEDLSEILNSEIGGV